MFLSFKRKSIFHEPDVALVHNLSFFGLFVLFKEKPTQPELPAPTSAQLVIDNCDRENQIQCCNDEKLQELNQQVESLQNVILQVICSSGVPVLTVYQWCYPIWHSFVLEFQYGNHHL